VRILKYGDGYLEEQQADEESFSKDYKYTCRICLSGEWDKDDPLISACKWSGTCRFIHLACVKECLKSRMTERKTDYYVSLTWDNVFCELCKTKYPDTIQLEYDSNSMRDSNVTCQEGMKMYHLIDVPEEVSQNPYVMMDWLNVSLFKKKTSKVVYFIKMIQETVIVGRGQAANVRLADISISRQHTNFHLTKDNEMYLTDHGSKFGTLILQKEPIKLIPHKVNTSIFNSLEFILHSAKWENLNWGQS